MLLNLFFDAVYNLILVHVKNNSGGTLLRFQGPNFLKSFMRLRCNFALVSNASTIVMKRLGVWRRNVSSKFFCGYIFQSYTIFTVRKISFQYIWKFFSNLIIMVAAVMVSDAFWLHVCHVLENKMFQKLRIWVKWAQSEKHGGDNLLLYLANKFSAPHWLVLATTWVSEAFLKVWLELWVNK